MNLQDAHNERIHIIAILLTCLIVTSCDQSPKTPVPKRVGPPLVMTSFYPTMYFAERIAGDLAKVECPVPATADPIHWMPDRATIASYQNADLIVLNGAVFEKWVDKVSLPTNHVVKTADAFRDEWVRFEEAVTHNHGPTGEHNHEGIDGHTWLDPNLAKIQAMQIHARLLALLPEQKSSLDSNLSGLLADLDMLNRSFVQLSAKLKDRHVLASHPAYNYLQKRYAWNVTNLDLDPRSMPTDQVLDEIGKLLSKKPATILLWENAPTPEIAARFRDRLGLTSVVFSPCESFDDAATDYLGVMNGNIKRLTEVMETRP